MSTNDMAQDIKIVPIDKGQLAKVKLTDIGGENEIATLDIDVPAEVNVSDDRKFTKLKLTQGQQMQMNGLMNQLPDLLNVASLSKTVRLTFPKGVQGSLMPLKNGGYSTALVDRAGKIVGTASIDFPTFQTTALGAFTVMSIASGQYFLAQINNKLGQISSKLDEILKFLYGDKRAELLAEIKFIQFACKNYKLVMEHSEQRIATLVSLQSAKKVAMKDIEFYLADLDKKSKESATNRKKAGIADEMIHTQECLELSLQLYAMSNVLEVYYSENFDPNYISFVKEDASEYIRACEKRSLTCFGKLQGALAGAKIPQQKKDKVDDIVERMNEIITSPLEIELESTLGEASKEKQYYLTPNGDVYLLKAS